MVVLCRTVVITANPSQTLRTIESGIGIVRNYMMFDHPLKSVVTSPFLSVAHIGTTPPPTLQAAADTVRLMTARVDGFQASNVDNGFVQGNFLPLQEERWRWPQALSVCCSR